MNRTLKKAFVLSAALLPLVMAGSVYAETGADINIVPDAASNFTTLTDITFGGIVSGVITLAFILAAIIAFAFLVFGGITWITSGGDKAKTESARNMITAALVGLLIVFAAWAIMSLIQIFFGVSIFNFNLPTIMGGDAVDVGTI